MHYFKNGELFKKIILPHFHCSNVAYSDVHHILVISRVWDLTILTFRHKRTKQTDKATCRHVGIAPHHRNV